MLVSVLLFSALVATGDAPSITTRVDVTRAGDVAWNADPCTIEARRGTAVVATVTGDAVELTPGPVVLVVSCDAKEGTVRRSLRVDVRKPQTLKVTLAPGFVVATIDQGGTKTAGTIVVYDDNDIEVARGADRKALAVDAGSVRIVGTGCRCDVVVFDVGRPPPARPRACLPCFSKTTPALRERLPPCSACISSYSSTR